MPKIVVLPFGIVIIFLSFFNDEDLLIAEKTGNQEAPNPLFDREVRGKIEKLLVRRRYKIESPDRANYHLTYSYGIIEGLRRGTTTVFGPPRTEIVVVPDSQGGTKLNTITVPGDTTVIPRVFEAYTKQLTITVSDAADFRKYNKKKVVWVVEASITDSSTDLRTMMDYLLAASFMHFGQDTGKQITLSLSDSNDDIQYLRTATDKPRPGR